MKTEMSGERLFLLYAFPCASIREQSGKLSPRDVAELTTLVYQGRDPSHGLIYRCFCDAIPFFARFAGINPRDESLWPIKMVRTFWRTHQGCAPECAVKQGEVIEILEDPGNPMWVRINGEGDVIAFNKYRLSVAVGDTVFIHQHVIVEVEARAKP